MPSGLTCKLKKKILNSVQKVEFVQSFVGGAIPYHLDTGLQFPAQTLAESGKCSDKSFLAAAILANMGYKVALLSFHTKNHMTVGVALDGTTPSYSPAVGFDYNGTKYYFLEVTAAGWKVGQSSSGLEAVEPEAIIPVSCKPAL
ncbi:Copper amine oxidase domain protein (fragment) [Syntrophaceticus schinkii]|uniref:Copper amine oxidase domain protein n=1 Tax=Syntrophaceticus schinkii TaxID=499207 RepID=A0A0B7MR58_9FIRM